MKMKLILFLIEYWLIFLIVLVRPVFDTITKKNLHPSHKIDEDYQRYLEGTIDKLKKKLCLYEEEFVSLLQNSRDAIDEVFAEYRDPFYCQVNKDRAREKIHKMEESINDRFQSGEAEELVPSLEERERNSSSPLNLNKKVRELYNTTVILRKSIDRYEQELPIYLQETRRAIDEVYTSGCSCECEKITKHADEILSKLDRTMGHLVYQVTCSLPSSDIDLYSSCYINGYYDCSDYLYY